MHILYIASDTNLFFNQIGGAGTHIRATIEYLEKRHRVTRAIGGDLLVDENIGQAAPIKAIKRKKSWRAFIPSSLKLLFQDIRILRRNKMILSRTERLIVLLKPDVIYERSCYGYSVGYKLAKKYNIPRCMETDVLMLDLVKGNTSYIFNRFFYRFLEQKKFSTADAITVQSEYSISLCKKYWKISHNRVFNKGLGIDLSKRRIIENTHEIDALYNIKEKFIVGFVGIFQKYQKVDLLIQAAAELKDIPDICFLIIGTGWGYEKMLDEVKERKLTNVILTGKIPPDKIHTIYNRMNIGIIPDCAYHMYPVKYLEYSLYNKATVIPKYEVFKQFFYNNSYYEKVSFSPANFKEMAKKIIELKNNNNLRDTIAKYSSEYIRANHTWDKCGGVVEQALIECIAIKKVDNSASYI